jgi:hypothetical protein
VTQYKGPWPRPGRCSVCLQPAEQAPSGNWWHLTYRCPQRSQWLIPAGSQIDSVPLAGFVGDDELPPTPPVDLDAIAE